MKLLNILKEMSSKTTFTKGCVMLFFNFPEVENLHNLINPDDLYNDPEDPTFGIEDEPHTTLLFGLDPSVTLEQVTEILNKYQYSDCKIYNASLFENEKYDVLKFDVEGDMLKETNYSLKKLPYKSNFPGYHPHLTIAYLKPGKGKKYVESLQNQQFMLVPTHAVYSFPPDNKVNIKINVI